MTPDEAVRAWMDAVANLSWDAPLSLKAPLSLDALARPRADGSFDGAEPIARFLAAADIGIVDEVAPNSRTKIWRTRYRRAEGLSFCAKGEPRKKCRSMAT